MAPFAVRTPAGACTEIPGISGRFHHFLPARPRRRFEIMSQSRSPRRGTQITYEEIAE
jgi:hypothetical protein